MTHDWMRSLEGLIAEKIREGALEPPQIDVSGIVVGNARPDGDHLRFDVSREYEFGLTADVMERWQTIIGAELARQRAEDNALLTDAAIAARELDQGLMIVQREGRVVSAEPSPYILSGTAYVVDGNVLGVLHDKAEWGAPQWSRDDPLID